MKMNDFELIRDLRALRQPLAPAADLWPDIAARIAPPVSRRRSMWPEALAACVVLGFGVLLGHGARLLPSPVDPMPEPWSVREARALDASFSGALREARRGLPAPHGELARAERELDVAQRSLEDALVLQPEAVHLLDLLRRTHEQRLRLLQRHAGIG